RERALGREKNDINYRNSQTKIVQLQFTINNKSETPIDNLRIEYRIYVNREQLNVPNSQFIREEIVTGKLTISKLDGGKEEVLDAIPAIKLIDEEYHANVIPSQGNKRSSQDKVSGYWYRV